jgi:hypothetical protein
MLRRTGLPALALLLFGAAPALAQQGVLDLIPANASAAVAVRNLDELATRGDKLVADAQLQLQNVQRPSQLIAALYGFLGGPGAVDAKGTAAFLVARPQKQDDWGRWGIPNSRLFVGVAPIGNRALLAGAFGLKPEELRKDKAVRGKVQGGPERLYLLLRDKHLYLGEDEQIVTRASRAKPLRDQLPAGRRKRLQEADLLAFIDPWSLLEPEARKEVRKHLESGEPVLLADFSQHLADDKKAKQALVRLVRALGEVRYGLGTARVEGGLGLSFVALFPEKGAKASAELLADLRSGQGGSSLRGLPEGPALLAYASRAEGPRTAPLARALAAVLLRSFGEAQHLLSAANRPVYTEMLGAFWRQLQGSRAALYETSDERKYGLFSLVAILDTPDAAGFLAGLRGLARIAEEPEAKAQTKEAGPDLAQLVRDLSSPTYRVREMATIKLRLVGEPALPHLKKALTGTDLETYRRAEKLTAQIRHAADERRRDLLAGGLPKHLHPSFVFAARPEERAGQRIEVVRVKLGAKDVPAAKQLRGLLGPDWDRVRLVARGDKLVVLVGSEVRLLDQTLANLQAGKPGLAATAGPAALARQTGAARTAELHLSIERLLALTRKPDNDRTPARGAGGLTSFGLTVGAADLQADVWLPPTELGVLLRQGMIR